MTRRVVRIALEALCLLVLVGMIVFLIAYWKHIPDMIPTHFDALGQITSWGRKTSLLTLPAIGLALYVALGFTNTFQLRSLGKRVRVPASKEWMAGVKLAVLALFAAITVFSALTRPLPAWFLPVFLAAVFVPAAGMTADAFRRR